MFVKSKISKRVGFAGSNLDIPDLKEVRQALELAAQGSENSAVQLLNWHRYCVSPCNKKNKKTMDFLSDSLKKIFEEEKK